jgi:metallo-beta-lactamase family protein
MAIKVTQVFKKHGDLFDSEMAKLMREKKSPFDFPGLKMTQSTDESKALNTMEGTKMIIAGSGMCTGGRVKHHLVNNISNEKNTILFVGYQAVGTLGRSIVDGHKQVRILGQQYPVRARVAEIKGFSAHADRQELLEWLDGINPRRVFVVHGEAEAAREFGKLLREQKGWKVNVPIFKERVVLD